jgi:uncharacterized membrane-anchored protein
MKAKLLLLVIALQTTWVVATVAFQETKFLRGQMVLLEAQPVDPRDFLRGDYVTLTYNISTVPTALLQVETTNELPAGTTVFVRLGKQGQFDAVESASLTPVKSERGHPVLRGQIPKKWYFSGGPNGSLLVEYGLERFYVHEGTGQLHGKLTVEAAVPASGRGVIKQLYVDGVPYSETIRAEKH